MPDESKPAATPEAKFGVVEEKEPSAADRVIEAIRGKPARSLPAVLASDVLALVAAVPDEKQTEVTLSLAKGSAAAVRGLLPSQAGGIIVHPQAGDLAKLLEAAGVHAQ